MNELKIFEKEEFGAVRVLEIEGAPWFVGKDVAEILGYERGWDTISRHVDKEDTSKQSIPTNAGSVDKDGNTVYKNTELTFINESGVYALIMGSKLPKAKDFKRWVTGEVLPSIRRTGGYRAAEGASGTGVATGRTSYGEYGLPPTLDVDRFLELVAEEVSGSVAEAVAETLRRLKPDIIDTLIKSVDDFLDEYDVANTEDVNDLIYAELHKSDYSDRIDALFKRVSALEGKVRALESGNEKIKRG